MTLDLSEVQQFYDRFGKKQDLQGFYEDPALDELIGHARFDEAKSVFEFGCGTGRFAARLLSDHLPASATYCGCDLSRTMVDLARERLASYGDRAQVLQSEGGIRFPLSDHSVDRIVSTYVLDLLSESDIEAFLHEAYRVIEAGGTMCVVSLTRGTTFASRIVSGIWAAIFRMRASLVGGCRPIRLEPYIDEGAWEVAYQKVVIAYGVPSDVLIVRARES
ncbi:MAG: class I SAM-dependent methyltransferase [Deltaproteobacteria bacterium]|nr:class I SAM-dependent methyltransferase [Deltaproteobacteria bacterium]